MQVLASLVSISRFHPHTEPHPLTNRLSLPVIGAIGMNPTIPLIVLDGDDDDVQVTAVRKVQHSQPLPDHHLATKNEGNPGSYPQCSCLSSM